MNCLMEFLSVNGETSKIQSDLNEKINCDQIQNEIILVN